MRLSHRAAAIGFTLIELLVVITIIVVLLAMLAPAMDRAVYQAQLATCAARIDAVCGSVMTYAVANRRTYPPHAFSSANKLKENLTGADPFRPILRSFVSINASMNDPLAPRVLDLDRSPAEAVIGSYMLWFGWGFDGEQKMRRIGDRWTLTAPAAPPAPETVDRFSVLVSDNAASVDPRFVRACHPNTDEGNSLGTEYADNERVWATAGAPSSYTFSSWAGNVADIKALRMDLNHGFEDGSVRRYRAARLDKTDERLTRVPGWSNKQMAATTGFFVPPE